MDRKENWKPIIHPIDYTGKYEISDKGNVKSWWPDGSSRLLKGSRNHKNGVKRCTLSRHSKNNSHAVRQLVADHFLEPDDSKPYVINVSGDRSDNSVENVKRTELTPRQYDYKNMPKKKYRTTYHTCPYSADNHYKV